MWIFEALLAHFHTSLKCHLYGLKPLQKKPSRQAASLGTWQALDVKGPWE